MWTLYYCIECGVVSVDHMALLKYMNVSQIFSYIVILWDVHK